MQGLTAGVESLFDAVCKNGDIMNEAPDEEAKVVLLRILTETDKSPAEVVRICMHHTDPEMLMGEAHAFYRARGREEEFAHGLGETNIEEVMRLELLPYISGILEPYVQIPDDQTN